MCADNPCCLSCSTTEGQPASTLRLGRSRSPVATDTCQRGSTTPNLSRSTAAPAATAASALSRTYSSSSCAQAQKLGDAGQALDDLDRARFASRNGRRRVTSIGFPRFKRKGKSRDRFRLTGLIRVGPTWVQLPKLGKLRLSEPPVKLVRRINAGTAHITSASVSREAQRWYVSIRVECKRRTPGARAMDDFIGLDLGINALVTLSNGAVFPPAPALRPYLRRLRRLSKAHSRKKQQSANRRRSAARLARCHARIAHLRRDYLHKLSTSLVKNHGRIVVETLTVRGMIVREDLLVRNMRKYPE